ncbi:MAG TPA: ethanolamine ammonia-lyase, partial [Synergistaceae bacterium]|nr:ethanolamine ammonia-lyase [Synergistaceae bacterium]
PRPKVDHWLRFRADHAAANDAVLREVPEGLFDDLGYFEVLSQAQSKDDYLTRPDLGRLLSDEGSENIRTNCPMGAEVQIIVADGLSSLAVERNAPEFIPAFEEVVKSYGLKTGQGFFVRHGRVGIMNAVGELLAPEVLLLLIGERPGLVTAESMSAYICYKPTRQTIESDRSLVSNIHPGGIPAIEAAAHVAELVKTIHEARASGLNLRKA